MNNRFMLGLDIGTSGVKGLLIDEKGKTITSAFAGYPLFTPKPTWIEQNPEDWWEATVKVIKEIVENPLVKREQIAGIGFSGQMHSLVLLGKNDEVLRPAILWSDTRTDEECRQINQLIGLDVLRRTTANPAIEGFTLPKLLWVQKHEPQVYEKINRIFLPKDFIRFKLTGECGMEVSDASGTILYDVCARKWSDGILKQFSIPKSWLSPVFESIDVCGKISQDALKLTGLPVGIPVAGGGGDNSCGAIGAGVIHEGQMLAGIGTSGIVLAPINNVRVDPEMRVHTFCHSVPHRWYAMGVMLMAGGALRWYKDTFAQAEVEQARSSNRDVYDVITEGAAKISPGSEGLYFQPYLAGERTPHRSANARAAFIGATLRHTKNHFSRAVLEGVTYGMRDSLEIIKKLGIQIGQIRLTGGGAKSAFWRQLQANIYGSEVAIVGTTEGSAYGAALLGGTASGVFGSIEEAVNQTVSITERIQPDVSLIRQYDDYYGIYSKIFPNLKESYASIRKTFTN
ncbi:MAG: xylulokinase [Bacteroidota bacterium]